MAYTCSIYIYIYKHLHIHTYTHTHTHAGELVEVCQEARHYIHVIYTYMYIYTHIRIHMCFMTIVIKQLLTTIAKRPAARMASLMAGPRTGTNGVQHSIVQYNYMYICIHVYIYIYIHILTPFVCNQGAVRIGTVALRAKLARIVI